MILLILAFGLMLLLCRHTEPEETRQPVVIVREQFWCRFWHGLPSG